MSDRRAWGPGWYGFDPDSDDHAAWGPERTEHGARVFPGADGEPERVETFVVERRPSSVRVFGGETGADQCPPFDGWEPKSPRECTATTPRGEP